MAAPVDVVWDAAVDWPAQGQWMPATSVRAVTMRGRGAGARIEARTAVGRLGFADPMTIIDWDPPRRCHVLHTGRVVRGTGTFAVEPQGHGSRFHWREDLDLPFGGVGRLGWVLVRPLVEVGLRLALRRFAQYVLSAR